MIPEEPQWLTHRVWDIETRKIMAGRPGLHFGWERHGSRDTLRDARSIATQLRELFDDPEFAEETGYTADVRIREHISLHRMVAVLAGKEKANENV